MKQEMFNEGDRVKVIANVDNVGRLGTIYSISPEEKHPFKVYFNCGGWCCYGTEELELLNSDKADERSVATEDDSSTTAGKKEEPEQKADWKQLREKFFNECTDAQPYINFRDNLKVSMAPHDLFEWFKKALEAIREDSSFEPEARKENNGPSVRQDSIDGLNQGTEPMAQKEETDNCEKTAIAFAEWMQRYSLYDYSKKPYKYIPRQRAGIKVHKDEIKTAQQLYQLFKTKP